MSDGTYIPSDIYIRYNICIFIYRVLVVPETELSKQSSQELISSPEKIQNILSDTTDACSDSDDQSFEVVQSRKNRRQQRWAALKKLKLPNFNSDSSHTSDSGNTNFLYMCKKLPSKFAIQYSFQESFNYMFHVHVQSFNSTTWFISMYYIYLLHVYTDNLPDLPFTEVPLFYQQPTKKTQDNKSTTEEEVISGRPGAHSTPIPSEVLSASDDLIYMGMDTGDSAYVDTANDVIIDEEDDQKDTK